MSNLGAQCQHSNFLNILSIFGAIKHEIIPSQSLEPGPPANWLSFHGDIHPAIQTFILLVTMEPTSLLAHYSAIAADHDYTLLEGQPPSQLPDTSWYIPSPPAPPIPFVLGQRVLLLSLSSRIFFGHLRSIVRLERSYLVITISKLTHALYRLYSKLQLITARFPVLQTCTENRQKNWPINLT